MSLCTFPLIWLNSGHFNFQANFFPQFALFLCCFDPKPPIFSITKLIFIIFVIALYFSLDLVEFWTHAFSCKFCSQFTNFPCCFDPNPPIFSITKLIFIIYVVALHFSLNLVEFRTHAFSCKFCPRFSHFLCCFDPKTINIFKIQVNFQNFPPHLVPCY